MRRRNASPAAVRSATVAVVLAVMFRSATCRLQHLRLLRRHNDQPAAPAIIGAASSFARKGGEGCPGRRRRRSASRRQARAITRSACCGFVTPPRSFSAAGLPSCSALPTTTAVQHHKASGADVEVGAVAGADLDAQQPRGTLGDREERRLQQEREFSEANAGPVVVDPMKTMLGGSGLEVCRVINGLCQGPADDTSGDCTDALRSMDRLAESGLTTFQLGNAAGGGRALAERRAGSYLKSAAGAASGSREVRFLNTLGLRRGVPVTRKAVKAVLEASLRRMGVDHLDLVQLCWRDFEDRYFLDALYYLEESECVSNVGVCGFPAAPLALADANGFTVVSNTVASSLIKAPGGCGGGSEGGSSGTGSLEKPTLVRQCRKQGVSMISSSGASLGGFAADEWAFRDAPSGSDPKDLTLASRTALSEILAWGTSAGAGGGGNNTPADPWRLYQTKLLPELQAIARKHGRGLSPADVATAFHLYRKETPSPRVAGVASPGANFENEARATIGTSVAAVTVPVRVKRGGSLSARRLADAEEDRVAGRRGAELAEALDLEDLERVAAAVGEGDVSRGDAHGAAIGNRGQDLLGGGAEGREEEEGGWGGELWELGVGAEAPTIFL